MQAYELTIEAKVKDGAFNSDADLAEDSQAGTVGAQDRAAPVRRLTDADLADLERHIHELDPTLAPDTVLP